VICPIHHWALPFGERDRADDGDLAVARIGESDTGGDHLFSGAAPRRHGVRHGPFAVVRRFVGGEVRVTSDSKMIVRLDGGGDIRPLPLTEVKSIVENTC
jgi:hypothetical protein